MIQTSSARETSRRVDPILQTLEAYALERDHWLLLGTWKDDARVRVDPFAELELDLSALWARCVGATCRRIQDPGKADDQRPGPRWRESSVVGAMLLRVPVTTAPSPSSAPAQAARTTWLFSRNVDLSVFAGAALVSFGALALGALTGVLHEETPAWAWVPALVLCDVAHVWSTAFRTYLDPAERRARPWVLGLVPVLGLLASVALFAVGELTFWRALAYLAIFHFVRQQYGWVALYRSRGGESDRAGRIIDTLAIYAATLWPLLYWHTHLPRRFSWFFPGDVVSLPPFVMPAATAAYVAALSTYAIRAAVLWWRGTPRPGKDIVVVTTAAGWYVGIVAFDSDYAFTVTNVFMHGIPYFALVFVHTRARGRGPSARGASDVAAPRPSLAERLTRSVFPFLGVLWLIAFVEELLWDRAVWHDKGWLFGDPWSVGGLKLLIVPLLALPQLTHYVLDGFIWRRRSNPSVATLASPQA